MGLSLYKSLNKELITVWLPGNVFNSMIFSNFNLKKFKLFSTKKESKRLISRIA